MGVNILINGFCRSKLETLIQMGVCCRNAWMVMTEKSNFDEKEIPERAKQNLGPTDYK